VQGILVLVQKQGMMIEQSGCL